MPQSLTADQMGCSKREAKPKALSEMSADPLQLFDEWLAEARASEPNDPEAMALATADAVGNPSVRMVLLKGHGPEGFVFYTNEESEKGRQLKENPSAALLFHWKSLRRQVRIEGNVERVSSGEADAYFASRSRDSQLGAWASQQSKRLESRQLLEARYEEMKERFEGQPVPRPPYWGGFKVVPLVFEFWEDRPHRLHERRIFLAQNDESWASWLLCP
jgi:pyridoxamine 5'-phosphate oxidase